MATKTRFQKIYFYFSLTIVLALFVLIFCLSHQSGEDSTETSGWFTALLNFVFPFELTESFVRTMAHFSEFACLSFFMNNLFVAYKEKLMPVFAIALSFFYAITDEIHQIFIPGRACQFLDMMVDLAGIVSGMFVFTILYLLTNKLINKKVLSAKCWVLSFGSATLL